MPRSVEVSFGGRRYVLEALPIRAAKRWRAQLAQPFGELVGALETAGVVEINQVADMAGMMRHFSNVLLGSMETMLDLLCAYAPALAAEREWIEAEAYDDEVVAAFAEALKLAFPFGAIWAVVNGPTANRTASSLPTANGTSGLPASGPPRRISTT